MGRQYQATERKQISCRLNNASISLSSNHIKVAFARSAHQLARYYKWDDKFKQHRKNKLVIVCAVLVSLPAEVND